MLAGKIAYFRATAHPEALAWQARVVANGGSVSASTLAAVSAFCRSIDAAGLRDRFYRLNLFCGAGLTAALVPLYRGQSFTGTQYGNATDTNVNFVSGDYSETGVNGGLLGDGTTKYLNTGFVPNVITFGNAHVAGYVRVAATNAFAGIVSSYAPNGDELSLCNTQSVANKPWFFAEENTATGYAEGAVNAATGFLAGASTSTTDRRCYRNGSQSGPTVTNALTRSSYGARELWVFARNSTTGTFPHNGRIAGYSFGGGMASSQMAAYNTAMQAFQAALTRTV